MDSAESHYRVEDLLTSYYRIAKVKKINYQKYIPKKLDDQWFIHTELLLRKQNPKVLVALFSREIWCFSINDAPLPTLPCNPGDVSSSDRKGEFTSNFSKPNLPTPYAVFLKALRRMIHLNMSLQSKNLLIPFGNSCILKHNEESNKIIHFESHLFENGDLCVSICMGNFLFKRLTMNSMNPLILSQSSIYMAPSGIKVHLPSSNPEKCLSPPPKNANSLLTTLLTSHGINLIDETDIKWVSIIPNPSHLNGYTPTISKYLDIPQTSKTIIWPMDLCFMRMSIDSKNRLQGRNKVLEPNLEDCFDIINDFIQLKLTSSYRTPSVSNVTSTVTGNNQISTGGAFTDQFQHVHGYSNSSIDINNSSSVTSYHFKNSPNGPSNSVTGFPRTVNTLANDRFENGFITTPNVNENSSEVVDTSITNSTSVRPHNDLWNERKSPLNVIDIRVNSKDINRSPSKFQKEVEILKNEDLEFDEGLFGKEDEEDLFGEKSCSVKNPIEKDITDDMLELMDDDSDIERKQSTVVSITYNNKSPLKRKYLDIPLDEITLPNTPLYTDPGAPLPIDTPRDRRKSVFAPLNFNPIIESNVDNKYKDGGKFSFDPSYNEEPLRFEVSTANISSSEDDETEFSDEDFHMLNSKTFQEHRSTDVSIPISHYESHLLQNHADVMSSELLKEQSLVTPYHITEFISPEKARDVHIDQIWKISNLKEFSKAENPNRLPIPLKESIDTSINVESDNTPVKNNIPLYFERPTNFVIDEKIPAMDKSSQETSDQICHEVSSTDDLFNPQIASGSLNSLPFILRHMPLFSIPEQFLSKNPILLQDHNFQDVLEILCDQIVFGQFVPENISESQEIHTYIQSCENGIIYETLQNSFGEFQRIHGNDIIDEIFYLKQPHVYVRKHDEIIKIKSGAQSFITNLHLKPDRGMKNFRTLILTTDSRDKCNDFITCFSQTYANQELGFCELVKLNPEDNEGLIFLKNFNDDALLLFSAQIVSYCSIKMTNLKNVPLLIFLPMNECTLEEIIFMILKFQLIKNEVKSKLPNLEVLLKLVPLNFLKNSLSSIEKYNELSINVYNLLPPAMIKFTSIADNLPDKVEFKTTNNAQNVNYDSYIHLAYTRSIDREWLCASWSDSKGKDSLVKIWHVGNSKTRFEEVSNEIWKITIKISFTRYGKVCLILTRLDNVLPDDELMHWRRLSVTTRNLHLAVVCVGENTKTSFFDEDKMYPSFKPLYLDEKLSSVVDKNNIDDYEIINIDEEVHGIIFSSPLQLANSQHRCAIKSGLLIRFKKGPGHSLVDKFEVNLLNCPHADSTNLLKTILRQFRDLASLNFCFGVSSHDSCFIPWHVLAVSKIMNVIVHLRIEKPIKEKTKGF